MTVLKFTVVLFTSFYLLADKSNGSSSFNNTRKYYSFILLIVLSVGTQFLFNDFTNVQFSTKTLDIFD